MTASSDSRKTLEHSEFSAPEVLARGMCDGSGPYAALQQSFSKTMERVGGQTYVGYRLPLPGRDDVIEAVQYGNEGGPPQRDEIALAEWSERMAGHPPAVAGEMVEKAAFRTYLCDEKAARKARRDVTTPAAEAGKLFQVEGTLCRWFRPEQAPHLNDSRNRTTTYWHLADELKVIALYLAYLAGGAHGPGLRALLVTRDWAFLATAIRSPASIMLAPHSLAAIGQINACLSDAARECILGILDAQATVGHRALADEYALFSDHPTHDRPSADIQDRMLAHTDANGSGLSAICLSGGGIRSASFCLGALQALAAHGLFGRFHYLSTVSGGGYIGTALTRWMTSKALDFRTPAGPSPNQAVEFAQAELAWQRSADYVRNRMIGTDFDEEGPLTWLRMNSNYLARRLSLFSADAWTIVAVYLRNLLIVWSNFWPWFSAFLLVPWLAVLLGQYGMGIGPPFDYLIEIAASVLGIVGATYFYQGMVAQQRETRYANRLKWPKGGDKRAAFGALLLVLGSLLLSFVIFADLDAHPGKFDLAKALDRYKWVIAAIFFTQFGLAELNVRQGPEAGGALARSVMYLAALLSFVTLSGLIIAIRWISKDWTLLPGRPDLEAHALAFVTERTAHTLSLMTTLRALVMPILILVALLLGEAVKAAVRSFCEAPERREHQGRSHAFVFMLLTAWTVSAALVIGAPALLTFFGDSVPTVTAGGSALSLAISTYFGYKKSSPGKPEAQAPVSFTLVGSIGIVLLALLVSIGAWKVFERTTSSGEFSAPVRCKCAYASTTASATPVSGTPQQNLKDASSPPGKKPNDSIFRVPEKAEYCQVPDHVCVDRSFGGYFNELIGKFDTWKLFVSLLALAATGLLCYALGFIIRMNEFSLHGFYRDRLVRGFYGGFRGWLDQRKPLRFTGFDPDDDIRLSDVQKGLFPSGSSKFDAGGAPNIPPFLVVNTALNLVKGTALAWQERKADSFTLTALAGGNYRLGFRPIGQFAGGMRLGTAMAISGAAFNPNMGYNSSTPMAFLMSVFNVRLGWWLGNPKFERWDRRDPGNSSWILLQEAAGQTTDTKDWIHLSDGGHFDNMGLWEMVHRRCRQILVIDASQDGRFSMEDFYSTLRKIRIDMGIDITPDGPVLLFPRSARASGIYHARFRIEYPGPRDGNPANLSGVLLYLKPCIYGNEPPDIEEYARKHADFPHESTADQFFSESQFESYRKLGEWEMKQLLRHARRIADDQPLPDNIPMNGSFASGPGLFS